MSKFDSFFLMKPDDAKEYAVQKLGFFKDTDDLECREIGDGNINYVFRVWRTTDGKSVIIKQADKLLRSSGRPLDIHRNEIEAKILSIEGNFAPEFIPKIYCYDETMYAISMEDISEYRNLRKELSAGHIYGHLADNLSDFFVKVLLPTTDLVMNRQKKKEYVKFFTNPELCDITEDLVLTEPYYNYKNRNIITPGNEEFVEHFLYQNEELRGEVGKLRNYFMNNAQALLHGDLHTGSIFANEKGVKIIDPEFAFYGPIGYDIGNVIGNLFFSLVNKMVTSPEKVSEIQALKEMIGNLFDLTKEKMENWFDENVNLPLYKSKKFKTAYINQLMSDSLGYAGTEIIRRVVGDTKVIEVTSVEETSERIALERILIKTGIVLICKRSDNINGNEMIKILDFITA